MSRYRIPTSNRFGYTLVELAVSLSVVGILLGAMGSIVIVAGKAVPETKSSSRATFEAQDALALMSSELRGARTVTELTSNAVTFTVADRNGDGSDETIRYYWAGSSGSPGAVRRVYNGVEADLVPNVSSFSLTGDKTSATTTQTVSSTVTSSEAILASFANYSSGTTTAKNFGLEGTASSFNGWAAEYFVPTGIPANATKVNITKVLVMMKQGGGGQTNYIEVRKAAGGGSKTPQSTAVGTPFAATDASLGTSYAWVTATFSDVNSTSITQDYCVVVRAAGSSINSYLYALYNATAPSDTPTLYWSNNSGSAWLPSSNTNQQDIPFYVYGTYQTPSTTTQTVTTYFLQSVTMSLCAGSDSTSHVDTTVATLNQPQVSGP
jgi:prepilin-type N-terminal cleavage/methylation domain-containing protein